MALNPLMPNASKRLSSANVLVLSICGFITLLYMISRNFHKSAIHMICNRRNTPSRIYKSRGRRQLTHPSPKCCTGVECLKIDQGRHAILTTLRTDAYLPYLRLLACSLSKSNPNAELLVAIVDGDLSDEVLSIIPSLGPMITIIYWEEFKLQNTLNSRYEYNWIKVRAWDMLDYDALIILDCDMVVMDDITHLFTLPAHFAAVLDEDKESDIYSSLGSMQGGMIFLRPCHGVAEHMINLLMTDKALQFTNHHAEQDFFDWYYRYDRFILPTKYNNIRHLLDDDMKNRAGESPVIIHYTRKSSYAHDMIINSPYNCSVGR